MEEILTNIDFNDSSYNCCKADSNELVIHLNSWDEKTIKIIFFNPIQFFYAGGSYIRGIYEKIENEEILYKAMSLHYDEIPKEHSFKLYVIQDIEDRCFFEIIAEKVSAIKE